MKAFKSVWRGIRSGLGFLASCLLEPLVYLIYVGLFFAALWLIFNALGYWRDALSRVTGWDRDAMTRTGILFTAGPLVVLGIRSALKEDAEKRRQAQPDSDAPPEKRPGRWSLIWLACLAAAVILAVVLRQLY